MDLPDDLLMQLDSYILDALAETGTRRGRPRVRPKTQPAPLPVMVLETFDDPTQIDVPAFADEPTPLPFHRAARGSQAPIRHILIDELDLDDEVTTPFCVPS